MTSKPLNSGLDLKCGGPEMVPLLSEVLEEGTEALAGLDVPALQRLQQKALVVQKDLESRAEGFSGTAEAREQLDACRRIFGEVLRSTGEHLNLLRRISSQGKELPWGR